MEQLQKQYELVNEERMELKKANELATKENQRINEEYVELKKQNDLTTKDNVLLTKQLKHVTAEKAVLLKAAKAVTL